jgi:hypothetical protein
MDNSSRSPFAPPLHHAFFSLAHFYDIMVAPEAVFQVVQFDFSTKNAMPTA